MSSKSQRFLVITASTRPGRVGPVIARWFVETVDQHAQQHGVALEPVDLAELALPFVDEPNHPSTGTYRHEHTRRWSAIVDRADGFIVVTPEYNFGMPATLKNAFDFLYSEWANKPVAFVSYGNTSAGTRAVQMAKQVTTTLRMMAVGATVALRLSQDVDPDGRVLSTPRLEGAARSVVTEMAALGAALRALR